jgi:Protein of unknown function with HXXEE motif
VLVSRFKMTFGSLIAVQAAHSIEEYFGRLWESFPPARLISGLVSSNLERGFVIINVALLAFGVWCFYWPVRRGWQSAIRVAYIWITIEIVNGIGHPLWSLSQGGYTPGLATAPILLLLAVCLALQVRRSRPNSVSAVR